MRKSKCSLLTIMTLLMLILTGCAATKTKEIMEVKEQSQAAQTSDSVKISEFILGVGDSINITVYRHDDLQRSVRIDNSGKIMLPLIGDVQAAEVSIFKLRDEIKRQLCKYIIDPQVMVTITTIQSQKIVVLGEVNNPGIFTLDYDTNIMEAISRAGGMTNNAKLANVLLIRPKQGKPEIVSLDLKKALRKGDFSQNVMMQNGDIVYIPAVIIANVSRYFSHISQIISPFVSLESGIVLWPQVKDVLQGKETKNVPLSIPTQ